MKIQALAAAFVAALMMSGGAAAEARGHDPEHHGPMMGRLAEKLGLDEQQKAKVDAIMQDHFERVREQMQAMHESLRDDLAEVLTDEQLAKFDELHEQRRARFKERMERRRERRNAGDGAGDGGGSRVR